MGNAVRGGWDATPTPAPTETPTASLSEGQYKVLPEAGATTAVLPIATEDARALGLNRPGSPICLDAALPLVMLFGAVVVPRMRSNSRSLGNNISEFKRSLGRKLTGLVEKISQPKK